MDVPAVIRRNRRNHRRNKLLEPRPKKALTGYGAFLQEYWIRNNPGGGVGLQARAALRAAGEEWRSLEPGARMVYNDRCATDRGRYAAEIRAWKEKRNALKRPASPYGLFLKQIWERERDSGRSVGEMGHYAAGLWRQMDENAKQEFQRLYNAQADRYRQVMQTVTAGGPLNINWRAELTQGVMQEEPAAEEGEELEDEEVDGEEFEEDEEDGEEFEEE